MEPLLEGSTIFVATSTRIGSNRFSDYWGLTFLNISNALEF